MPPLFAALSWRDPDVLVAVAPAVCGVLAAALSLCGLVFRVANRSLRNRADALEKVVADLRHQLASDEIADARGRVADLEADLAARSAERDAADAKVKELSAGGAGTRAALDAESRRVRKALDRDGSVWTDKVYATAPEFKPLDPEVRKTPIVSVLNLKGGVGKTTSVANLAAAFAHRGYRVLLVDLDLQGSLTGMFLPYARQEELANENRLVRNFLLAATDGESPNINDHAADVLPGTKSAIVPTTDALAYAEMNLTVRWFLKDGIKDPRFLLRKELHLRRVTGNFDIVLIDCPPFLNVSCVNALAASDYVLTPVMPSKQSTDRVTVLLEFKTNLNPMLKMMGFFANRTKESKLTLDEENRLAGLRTRCHDAWGEKVHRFAASIRQSVDIREAEDQHRPLGPDDDMFPAYLALADEVEDQLPMFCRKVRTAAVAGGVP